MNELRDQFNIKLSNHLNKIKNPKIKEIVEHSLIGGKKIKTINCFKYKSISGN